MGNPQDLIIAEGSNYLKDESPMLGCAGATEDALIPVEEWSVEKGAESPSLLFFEGRLAISPH